LGTILSKWVSAQKICKILFSRLDLTMNMSNSEGAGNPNPKLGMKLLYGPIKARKLVWSPFLYLLFSSWLWTFVPSFGYFGNNSINMCRSFGSLCHHSFQLKLAAWTHLFTQTSDYAQICNHQWMKPLFVNKDEFKLALQDWKLAMPCGNCVQPNIFSSIFIFHRSGEFSLKNHSLQKKILKNKLAK
jgi:hypothetical protein